MSVRSTSFIVLFRFTVSLLNHLIVLHIISNEELKSPTIVVVLFTSPFNSVTFFLYIFRFFKKYIIYILLFFPENISSVLKDLAHMGVGGGHGAALADLNWSRVVQSFRALPERFLPTML